MTYEEARKEIVLEWCEGCSGLFCEECKFWYALEALGKQIPATPIKVDGYYVCPLCGKYVEYDDSECYGTEIIPACECGQIIDWESIYHYSRLGIGVNEEGSDEGE